MKRLVPLVALAAVAVLATGVLIAQGDDDAPRVQVAEVVRGEVAEVVEAPGSITARASATVASPADGVVEAVLVRDGEPVTAGQVLVRLASESAQARLRTAESAAADAAAAQIDLPRADLSPLQDSLDAAAHQSFAAGRAAAAQLQDPAAREAAERQVADAERSYASASAAARSAVQSANAGVGSVEGALDALAGAQRAQAQAAVTAARGVVEALTVRAPLDGIVSLGGGGDAGGGAGDLGGLLGSLPAEVQGTAEGLIGADAAAPRTTSTELTVGAPVGTGSTLLTVTDVSGLGVMAEVDETDVLLVEPGVQAQVEVDAVPGASYPATVTAVDVTPTPSTGGGVAYRVRLTLLDGTGPDGEPAPRPKPGMSAVVDLQVRTSGAGATSVPIASVLRDGGVDSVLVVEDGRVQRRTVELGAEGEDRVEVVTGVEAGQRVVARDADRLRDGQDVRSR